MHVGLFDDELRSTNKPKDNPDMKTFSLATLTGALIFTSSLAVAGPRPGPAFDHRHEHMYPRGGYARSGSVVRGAIARVAPHCVMPPVAAVFTPRLQVVSPRYAATPHPRATHVEPAPARATAPVVSAPQVPANPQSGGGKPSKPNGQGTGGTKPTKPAR
jgi:hypothetical protein